MLCQHAGLERRVAFGSAAVRSQSSKPYGARIAVGLTLSNDHTANERSPMLFTIALILVALWLLGMISSYTLGGWLHILLVVAVVVLLFRLLTGGRRAP